ncbi:MAG: alpha-glucan family phosphorylase [Candidatus Limnocylindria bacterium]
MAPPVRIPTLDRADLPHPPGLEGLRELAENLWWSWHPEARRLFARIDPQTWARSRNPIHLLRQTDADRWTALAADPRFVADAQAMVDRLHRDLEDPTPGLGDDLGGPVAYLCAEFALHESLPVYSGGLGVLAGDLCKAASDARLPMVAVGPFYHRGYFRQRIDADGRQEHLEPDLDPADLPLRRAADAEGGPLEVMVELPGRVVRLGVWVAQVGRVPLLLLDADLEGNQPEDRRVTDQLYVADRRTRLTQELLLGIGAARAVEELGIQPAIWHLNEGHSALVLFERARTARAIRPEQDGEAELRRAGRGVVLTLHTPVPAGNERYDPALAAELLGGPAAAIDLTPERLVRLGSGPDGAWPEDFDLTAFGLRQAAAVNAVSQLHGRTANHTWQPFIGREVRAVTNGVHVATWQAEPMRAALARRDLSAITDRDMWEAHTEQKRQMIDFLGGRLTRQAVRHGVAPESVGDLAGALDPQALTVGFARRFATYKRADLIMHDLHRLANLLANPDWPVQIIFAGKAHPADEFGRAMLGRVVEASRRVGTAGRIFFIEDYDLRVARFLVAGVDVWLNTPRRPHEASGTSGMKAAMNGVPSLSILDGWWDEAFDGANGWAIGSQSADFEGDTDAADAETLYRVLETEVVPAFFDRDSEGLPRAWIGFMRAALATGLTRFSAERVLAEYVDQLYRPVIGIGEVAAGFG